MKILLVTVALMTIAQVSQANDQMILACRQVSDHAQRFTCYEKIPVGVTSNAVASAGPAKLDNWGFARRPSDEAVAIDSELENEVDEWGPRQIFDLKNGHRWRISDDSHGVLSKATRKVSIHRGALGAHFMAFDGTRKQPKVVRVK